MLLGLEFGKIPNFGRLAEQAVYLTYRLLYLTIEIQQYVFRYYIKVYNCALIFAQKYGLPYISCLNHQSAQPAR